MQQKEQKRPRKVSSQARSELPSETAAREKEPPSVIEARVFSPSSSEKPIPEEIYPVLDTDLARDNLENDLAAADRSEL